MISRSQIRQTAVQLLYGIGNDIRKTIDTGHVDNLWHIILEKYSYDYHSAKLKAIKHLTRDYLAKYSLLEKQISESLLKLASRPSTDKIRDILYDILTQEKSFAVALREIFQAKTDDPNLRTDVPEKTLARFLAINETSLQLKNKFINLLNDLPEEAGILASCKKSLNKIKDINQLIYGLDHPEQCENKAEIENVISIRDDMRTLRQETNSLLKNIVDKIEDIDGVIKDVVQNYSEDRLSTIEKSIMRISIYEMVYGEKLPPPVIVSEAIKLAELYSVTEAPRFINGILGAAAEKYRKEDK